MKIKPSKEACEKYFRIVAPLAIEIAKKNKLEKGKSNTKEKN